MNPTPEHLSRRSWWRLFVTVFVAAPVAIYTLLCSIMATWMGLAAISGRGVPLVGVVFIAIAGLAVWFTYSLFASLWFGATSASVTLGLATGLIGLSLFVWSIGNDIFRRIDHSITCTNRDYYGTLGLGSLLLAGWILTAILFSRIAFADRFKK